MNRHELLDLVRETDAVSPVIGVILMVAITVILAAVIGAFALGFGSTVEDRTPRATFDFEAFELSGQPDEVRITHEGGDAIPNDELYVTADVQIQEESGSPGPADRLSWKQLNDDGDEVTAGDSVMVEPPNGDPEIEDKTIRIVWEHRGESATLRVWEGSDA